MPLGTVATDRLNGDGEESGHLLGANVRGQSWREVTLRLFARPDGVRLMRVGVKLAVL